MQYLVVPVLLSKVQIFKQAATGEKHQNVCFGADTFQDDYLIYEIKRIAAGAGITVSDEMEEVVESTKTRIYAMLG